MKKAFVTLLIIIGCYTILGQIGEKTLIPDEAIRIRVIANSNSTYDQEIKKEVKELVEKDMYTLLKDTKEVSVARSQIKSSLPLLENKIDHFLKSEKYPYS